MIITGIAPSPRDLHDRNYLPSPELVYLAKLALKEYQATGLITSLALGWEQALTKAAIELEIPFTVAIPYPGRDAEWERDAHICYLDLMARSAEVYRVSECRSDTALLEGHYWRVYRADVVLALWEYDFQSEVFSVMNYATTSGKSVVNLWEDWQRLYKMRRPVVNYAPKKKKLGAQVFERKSATSL